MPRVWSDAVTGRRVRQISPAGKGGSLGYFRNPRHLPDGTMLASIDKKLGLLEPESGDFRPITGMRGNRLKLLNDGTLLTHDGETHEFFATPLPGGTSRSLGKLLEGEKAQVIDITCDGRTVLMTECHDPHAGELAPTRKDPDLFWRYVSRPRHGEIVAFDLQTRERRTLLRAEDCCPFHLDSNPLDAGLLRFAYDKWEGHNQRVWSIRTDGSDLKPIRPQAHGELVTHEFWWPDGKHVGFTYQDRREDTQHHELPWCEYAPAKTRLGVADLSGKQVYLSDPVNHYHTHLYVSRDATLLSGSGTDGHSMVHAAKFSLKDPRVDYVPLATVHTPYVPFRGQWVNCDFDAQGRWLFYTDTIDGKLELCAVDVEL
ncbi:MAG: hypothetical protein NTW19_24990 [Planctomycetota bacterium]|nr:hypothetical protein [Planctomycetota bacterium]